MVIICRLCLIIPASRTFELTEECDIMVKLSVGLSHHISLHNDLPKVICVNCYKLIEDIYIFREKIVNNEISLQNKFNELYNSNDPTSGRPDSKPVEFDEKPFTREAVNERIANTSDESSKFVSVFVKNSFDDPINGQIDQTLGQVNSELVEGEIDINCVTNDDLSSEDELLCKPVQKASTKSIDNKDDLTDKHLCLTCFKKFPNRLDLLEHYENYEKQTTNEKDEKFEGFKYKMVSSGGVSLYRCELCNKDFRTKKFIKRHFLTHRDRPFLCKLCGRKYRTAIEITNHGKVHGGELFSCSYKCGYGSVYKHVLKEHERRHKNEYKYHCETCGKRFQVKTWYLQHKNVHTGLKPFVCNICSMAFHLDRYLTQHRNNVHPNANAKKSFVCMHCSIPCGSKRSLVLHLKEHNITTNILCDICGKVLKNANQLKSHKRIHINPRPYGCSLCEKRFAKKSNLIVHVRNHTGEKYPCDKCPRNFTQRSSLTRHKQRACHSYNQNCPKCNETFLMKKDLVKHKISCS